MSRIIKIHNTDIERELTGFEKEFYESQLKRAEESGQVLRAHLTEHGTIYYTIGEPNLDILAKFLYDEMIKQERKGTLKNIKDDSNGG